LGLCPTWTLTWSRRRSRPWSKRCRSSGLQRGAHPPEWVQLPSILHCSGGLPPPAWRAPPRMGASCRRMCNFAVCGARRGRKLSSSCAVPAHRDCASPARRAGGMGSCWDINVRKLPRQLAHDLRELYALEQHCSKSDCQRLVTVVAFQGRSRGGQSAPEMTPQLQSGTNCGMQQVAIVFIYVGRIFVSLYRQQVHTYSSNCMPLFIFIHHSVCFWALCVPGLVIGCCPVSFQFELCGWSSMT
jgi:hypothetical protein